MRGHLPVHFTVKMPNDSTYAGKEKPVLKTDIESIDWKTWTSDVENMLIGPNAVVDTCEDHNVVWNHLLSAMTSATSNNSKSKMSS